MIQTGIVNKPAAHTTGAHICLLLYTLSFKGPEVNNYSPLRLTCFQPVARGVNIIHRKLFKLAIFKF